MDWRLVQGVPHLSPNGSWDTLQPPVTLTLDLAGFEFKKKIPGLNIASKAVYIVQH